MGSTLLFNPGDNIAFERVSSWLDVNLKSPGNLLGNTVATNLTGWNLAPALRAGDISNLGVFAANLSAGSSTFAAFLKSQLAPVTLAALAAYQANPISANATRF